MKSVIAGNNTDRVIRKHANSVSGFRIMSFILVLALILSSSFYVDVFAETSYHDAVAAIDSKNPKRQTQLSRYNEDFTERKTGICNVSAMVTLLNRRLAYDDRPGSFTPEDVLTSLGCSNIKNSGTKYYYEGDTGKWFSATYSNGSYSYKSAYISSSTVKKATNKEGFYQYIASLLQEHPEGIAIRNSKANHVAVIYKFEIIDGSIQLYVKDPSSNYSGKLEGSYLYKQSGKDLYTKLDKIAYLKGSTPALDDTPFPISSDAVAASINYNGHTYERYDYNLSWSDAKAFCENKGGHLVTITSEAENNAVVELMSGCLFGYYHIGATNGGDVNGTWSWITSESFSYSNWDSKEPTKGAGEYYAAIIGKDHDPKTVGEWIDEPDTGGTGYYALTNCGFICEYERPQASIDKGQDGIYDINEKAVISLNTDAALYDSCVLKIYRTPPGGETYLYWEGQLFSSRYETSFSKEGYYSCCFVLTKNNRSTESKWVGWSVKQTATFQFDANGGSGAMVSVNTRSGDRVTLPRCTFTRDGYTFKGWTAYRLNDNKYGVSNVGWRTEAELLQAGLNKTVYQDQSSFLFDTFWTEGVSGHCTIRLSAVWEKNDTTMPVISNVTAGDISPTGYTVSCTVSDDTGVTVVRFPTWTVQNGQDDIIPWPWPEGSLSNGTATYRVNVSEHNGEKACDYITHIYAFDAAGNYSVADLSVYVPGETTTLSYDANGGTGAPPAQTKQFGTALMISEDFVPSRTGFTFLGWAESAAATAAQYQPGGSFTKEENITLYAVWQITRYENKLTLPDALAEIGEEAFAGLPVQEVVLPASVNSIGNKAFSSCDELCLVEFNGRDAAISQYAFDGCGDFVFYAPPGGSVQSYAERWEITFIAK